MLCQRRAGTQIGQTDRQTQTAAVAVATRITRASHVKRTRSEIFREEKNVNERTGGSQELIDVWLLNRTRCSAAASSRWYISINVSSLASAASFILRRLNAVLWCRGNIRSASGEMKEDGSCVVFERTGSSTCGLYSRISPTAHTNPFLLVVFVLEEVLLEVGRAALC